MNILIVAFHDPRSPAIGGQRTASLGRYLAGEGWGVALLTAGPAGVGCELIAPATGESWRRLAGQSGESPLAESRLGEGAARFPTMRERLYKYRGALLNWPDPPVERRWASDAIDLLKLAVPNHLDVVISSAPPWVTHHVAREVAKQLDIPWVADYRDLWSISPYYPYPAWRAALDRRIEGRLLQDVAAATTATPLCSRDLGQSFPNLDVKTILNGFDPPEMEAVTASNLGPGRHIVYAGNLYAGRRDPRPVLFALRTESMLDVNLHLVGQPDADLQSLVVELGLEERVHFPGRMPRQAALSYVRGADVALLLMWNDPREESVIPAKLYELMGLRRPILALGYSGGTAGDFLNSYGLGRFANTSDAIARAVGFLTSPAREPEEGRVRPFSRQAQNDRWAALLKSIILHGTPGED